MKLLIGCPVQAREWIIRPWMQHALLSSLEAGIKPTFLFATRPEDKTLEALGDDFKVAIVVRSVYEAERNDRRDWNQNRFHHMVEVRNVLLDEVRRMEPDFFLSLDSDILIHEQLITNLLETIEEKPWGAVGGKCYLAARARRNPNYAMLTRKDALHRPDAEGVMPVDVLMAIKLMSPDAYAVDYEFHTQGEDIGWSRACKRAGVTLGWDGRITSKHVMEQPHLNEIDPRCGY